MGQPPADVHSVKKLTKSALPVEGCLFMCVCVYMVRIYHDDFVYTWSRCKYRCVYLHVDNAYCDSHLIYI